MRDRITALLVGVIIAGGGFAGAAEEPPAELRIWCLAQLKTNEAADLLIARAGELAESLRDGKAGDKTWNDVIQMYDAVLQQYPDALYGIGDNVYVMASAYCRDRILEFPKDGLEAYTAVADAEADRKLRAARDAADPVALRDVVQRYFPTSSGDDACYELANHYLESGQYAAALAALRRIDDHPSPDVNRAAVWIRKAICLKRTGRAAELAELLRNPPKDATEFEAAGRTWKIADFLATEFDRLGAFRAAELSADGAWPMQGGNEQNNARIPEISSRFRKL